MLINGRTIQGVLMAYMQETRSAQALVEDIKAGEQPCPKLVYILVRDLSN